jgi:hypothetical protein
MTSCSIVVQKNLSKYLKRPEKIPLPWVTNFMEKVFFSWQEFPSQVMNHKNNQTISHIKYTTPHKMQSFYKKRLQKLNKNKKMTHQKDQVK